MSRTTHNRSAAGRKTEGRFSSCSSVDGTGARRGCELISMCLQAGNFDSSCTTPNYTRTSWDSFSSPTSYDNPGIAFYCGSPLFNTSWTWTASESCPQRWLSAYLRLFLLGSSLQAAVIVVETLWLLFCLFAELTEASLSSFSSRLKASF